MTLAALFESTSRGTFLDGEPCAVSDAPSGAVAVIGAPGASPYRSVGPYCATAPAVIRATSARYAANRSHYDFDLGRPLLPPGQALFDCGDVEFDGEDFASNRARIEHAVGTLLARGARPLLLGGDDSVQIPTLAAHARRQDITVLQIDAHIDWRDEVQGERFGLSSTMRRASEMPGVRSIVQVGARGIGSARAADVSDARAVGAHLVDMATVRRHGVAHAAGLVPAGRPVVVCFDVDALDPSIVPGVIGRAPGGLYYGQAVDLLLAVAARAPIVGFNIVEFVPEADIGDLGACVVCRLALMAVGLLGAGA